MYITNLKNILFHKTIDVVYYWNLIMDYRAYLDPLIIALAIENQEMIAKLSRSCSLVFSSSLELDWKRVDLNRCVSN
jgi:hypothetical protein